MPEPESPVLYVFDEDPEAGPPAPVAEAELLAEGRLRLARAQPAYQSRLESLFDRMNNMPVLQVEVSPPESAPRYALYEREVPRDDEQFFQALRDHLSKYYALRLSFEPGPAALKL